MLTSAEAPAQRAADMGRDWLEHQSDQGLPAIERHAAPLREWTGGVGENTGSRRKNRPPEAKVPA
jgi:hypothetical protein